MLDLCSHQFFYWTGNLINMKGQMNYLLVNFSEITSKSSFIKNYLILFLLKNRPEKRMYNSMIECKFYNSLRRYLHQQSFFDVLLIVQSINISEYCLKIFQMNPRTKETTFEMAIQRSQRYKVNKYWLKPLKLQRGSLKQYNNYKWYDHQLLMLEQSRKKSEINELHKMLR